MRYAIQTGRGSYNPAQDLKGRSKAARKNTGLHYPGRTAGIYRRLAAEPLNPATRLAFHLLMLTMTRPGEVRFARWG